MMKGDFQKTLQLTQYRLPVLEILFEILHVIFTWPAESLIFSTSGVPSESLKARMSFVISTKKESNSPLFHSSNTFTRQNGRDFIV